MDDIVRRRALALWVCLFIYYANAECDVNRDLPANADWWFSIYSRSGCQGIFYNYIGTTSSCFEKCYDMNAALNGAPVQSAILSGRANIKFYPNLECGGQPSDSPIGLKSFKVVC